MPIYDKSKPQHMRHHDHICSVSSTNERQHYPIQFHCTILPTLLQVLINIKMPGNTTISFRRKQFLSIWFSNVILHTSWHIIATDINLGFYVAVYVISVRCTGSPLPFNFGSFTWCLCLLYDTHYFFNTLCWLVTFCFLIVCFLNFN